MLKRDVFSTEEFKKQAKHFVFVTIDADKQGSVMSRFGVSAMPTIKMMKPDETVVREFVGYRPLGTVIQEMNAAWEASGY